MASPESITSFVQFLGLSAAIGGGIGGGISTLINYLVNIRDFKKKNKIRIAEEKIELYSYIIFQLDRMRFAWYALEKNQGNNPEDSEYEHFVYPEGDNKEFIKEMEKRLEKGYHLFEQEIMKEWAYISILFNHPSSIPKIPAFRRKVIEEYNNKIIPEYQKLTGYELQKKL